MTNHPNRSRTLKAIKRYLHLDIDSGSRSVEPADIDRALTAAARVLRDARADVLACQYEWRRFRRSDCGCDDYAQGEARVWLEAQQAADIALTAGWHDPNGASCTLYAEDVL